MGADASLDDAVAGRLSARHHREHRLTEAKQQRAYDGLAAARQASGMARIAIGIHLVTLHETEGWRGRTGAKSFRRLLLEEGVEPRAALQYMTVARSFVLEHAVSPDRIALVGMRVLVEASRYLSPGEGEAPSNVDDIVAIVTSLPSAEALAALRGQFKLNERAEEALRQPRTPRPVASILESVEGLTHEDRAELYRALHLSAAPQQQSAPRQRRTIRLPSVMAPAPPAEAYAQDFPR